MYVCNIYIYIYYNKTWVQYILMGDAIISSFIDSMFCESYCFILRICVGTKLCYKLCSEHPGVCY